MPTLILSDTVKLTSAINVLLGYRAVEINSPMEVIDNEETRYHLGRSSRNTPQD